MIAVEVKNAFIYLFCPFAKLVKRLCRRLNRVLKQRQEERSADHFGPLGRTHSASTTLHDIVSTKSRHIPRSRHVLRAGSCRSGLSDKLRETSDLLVASSSSESKHDVDSSSLLMKDEQLSYSGPPRPAGLAE